MNFVNGFFNCCALGLALEMCDGCFAWAAAQMRDLQFQGAGCLPGSATAQLYQIGNETNPSEFAIYFSAMSAVQGVGVPAGKRKVECRASLKLDVDKNRQFAMVQTRFYGYADLSEGVVGTQSAEYGFPGANKKQTFFTEIFGEYHDNFQRSDTLGDEPMWSECGKRIPFFVVAKAALEGNALLPGSLTVDQMSGLLTYRFFLRWRNCVP